jgi:hypothetical protein
MRLLHLANSNGDDLNVYWKAVQTWFSGLSPYKYTPAERGFVFKYPPWFLPFFAFLRWMGYEFAKGVWACAELVLLGFCVKWMTEHGISLTISLISTFLYWFIWLGHFSAGQITLFLLAAALWVIDKKAANSKTIAPGRGAFLFLIFSSKVFSLFSLLGIWRSIARPKVLFLIGLFSLVLHAIVFVLHSYPTSLESIIEIYRDWIQSAGSGAAELGYEVVRGTGNHGFPAAILRWVDPQAKYLALDVITSGFLALVVGVTWYRVSRYLAFEEAWAGWLALGVIIHPLAWHHSFVLTFPLSAYSLQSATRMKKNRGFWIGLAVLGISLITLIVPQTIGADWVKYPEMIGNKSWGVILCAWLLVRTSAFQREGWQKGLI